MIHVLSLALGMRLNLALIVCACLALPNSRLFMLLLISTGFVYVNSITFGDFSRLSVFQDNRIIGNFQGLIQ